MSRTKQPEPATCCLKKMLTGKRPSLPKMLGKLFSSHAEERKLDFSHHSQKLTWNRFIILTIECDKFREFNESFDKKLKCFILNQSNGDKIGLYMDNIN